MEVFFTEKYRKAMLIANLICFIVLFLAFELIIQPKNINVHFDIFMGVLVFQTVSMMLPNIIAEMFMKTLHPYEQAKELQKIVDKIKKEKSERDFSE